MYSGLHTALTEAIIGAAIEVHRELGPGLFESVYEQALCIELSHRSLPFARQIKVPLYYRGYPIAEYSPDLVVDDTVVVEVKSVARFEPVFLAQMLTYLRVTGKRVGLILNFNTVTLADGVRRVVR